MICMDPKYYSNLIFNDAPGQFWYHFKKRGSVPAPFIHRRGVMNFAADRVGQAKVKLLLSVVIVRISKLK